MIARLFTLVFSCTLCLFINIESAVAQSIESTPSGAKVYFEGSYLGKTPLKLNETSFPYKLVYKIRKDRIEDISSPPYSYLLTLKMDEYEEQTVRIIGEWKYISKYNDLDCVAGPKSNRVSVVMEKKDIPTIADVSPDVHWSFDSEPSGARVFWKVSSFIPDTVKNTDYIYLGTTPIDAIKPLSIKGLTSKNAAKVKIDVKIQSKGYKTEIKAFSAELLTEQQEISWFFELTE